MFLAVSAHLARQIPVKDARVVNVGHAARYTQRQSYLLRGAEHHLLVGQQLLQGAAVDVLGQGVQLALLHANAHEAEAKEEGIRLVKVCHCSATIRYGPNKFHFQSHNLTGTATSRTPDFLSPVDMQSATPH